MTVLMTSVTPSHVSRVRLLCRRAAQLTGRSVVVTVTSTCRLNVTPSVNIRCQDTYSQLVTTVSHHSTVSRLHHVSHPTTHQQLTLQPSRHERVDIIMYSRLMVNLPNLCTLAPMFCVKMAVRYWAPTFRRKGHQVIKFIHLGTFRHCVKYGNCNFHGWSVKIEGVKNLSP